jgi:twitching motility protein PilT
MVLRQTRELDLILQAAAERPYTADVYLVPNERVCFRDARGNVDRAEGDIVSADAIRAIAIAAVGEDRLARLGTELSDIGASCALPGVLNGRMCITRTGGKISIAIHLLLAPRLDSAAAVVPPAIMEAVLQRFGLVVFSGLPGSGKTTALLAAVDKINETRACRICTVEYGPLGVALAPKKALIQQREVGIDVPDLVSGIRAAHHQGCEVMVVDELPGPEDAAAVVRTAAMGHMVLTQTHHATPQAALRAISQVLDAPARQDLAAALRGVCAQRLLPRDDDPSRVVPAYGILIPDRVMRRAIAQGDDPQQRQTALPANCQTLPDHVRQLQAAGTITAETAAQALAELE